MADEIAQSKYGIAQYGENQYGGITTPFPLKTDVTYPKYKPDITYTI